MSAGRVLFAAMDAGHEIHRVDLFVAHLAEREPELLALLEPGERPVEGERLKEWVVAISQRRLMEICSAWVLETLTRLRAVSPISNYLLRGCMPLPGEFDLTDAAAITFGEVPPPADPRREEIRAALHGAVRSGLLIGLPAVDRYCIPFPVRLSFEGVEFLDADESALLRSRIIENYWRVVREAGTPRDLGSPRHWRFFNLLQAYEHAVEFYEEQLGPSEADWPEASAGELARASELMGPLVGFGLILGKALVERQSEGGGRLLAASLHSARFLDDLPSQADILSLKGQFHLRRQAHGIAAKCFGQCAEARRRIGDPAGALLAESAAALALRDGGETDAAIHAFSGVSQRALATGLEELALDAANCAGRVLLEQERVVEAAALLDEVRLALGGRGEGYAAIAELYTLHGACMRRLGNHTGARDSLLVAIESSRATGHRLAEAEAALEAGRLAADGGDEHAAITWFETSRKLFKDLASKSGSARTLQAEAALMRARGEDLLADGLLDDAVRAAQGAGDQALQGQLWRERAVLQSALGYEETSTEYLHHACRAFRKNRDASGVMDCHVLLARQYRDRDMLMESAANALRAQGLGRALLPAGVPEAVETLLHELLAGLTAPQVDYLLEQVSEELDSGKLFPKR